MRKFREILAGGDKGFTLIELLVVIAVLGILAGIAIPRITGIRDEAEKSALISTANTFRNAMEMYYAVEGEYPAVTANTALSEAVSFDSASTDLNITFGSDVKAFVQSDGGDDGGDEYTVVLETRDSSDATSQEIQVSSADGVTEVPAG